MAKVEHRRVGWADTSHMWVSAQILDAKTDTAAGAHTYSSENNRPEEEEEAGVFLLSTRRRKARRVL